MSTDLRYPQHHPASKSYMGDDCSSGYPPSDHARSTFVNKAAYANGSQGYFDQTGCYPAPQASTAYNPGSHSKHIHHSTLSGVTSGNHTASQDHSARFNPIPTDSNAPVITQGTIPARTPVDTEEWTELHNQLVNVPSDILQKILRVQDSVKTGSDDWKEHYKDVQSNLDTVGLKLVNSAYLESTHDARREDREAKASLESSNASLQEELTALSKRWEGMQDTRFEEWQGVNRLREELEASVAKVKRLEGVVQRGQADLRRFAEAGSTTKFMESLSTICV